MVMRDPYKSRISEHSLKGTYLKKKSRKLQKTGGFGDSPLATPRYETIEEENPGQQELVQIEIDDDFAKDIESDEYDWFCILIYNQLNISHFNEFS